MSEGKVVGNPKAHIPKVDHTAKRDTPLQRAVKDLFFDFAVLFSNIVVYIFFREVSTRGSFNLPKKGATIVVVAPHANQFVDAAIILSQIRGVANRNALPIIAQASYQRRVIGFFARLAGAIPVPRAQDNMKFVDGEIYIKEGQEDLTRIYGRGTFFKKLAEKGLIGLPEFAGNSDIQSIVSDTELILRKPFKSEKSKQLLLEGTRFKYAAKISNDVTFQHVFNALHSGGVIDIFPEGGSHDRPDLLPIKAGFAIMALGAVAADPSHPVQIVPTGLNYFHRNKFRSRAVVEFGTPIVITGEHGSYYKTNPREAVAKLLDEVSTALRSVTVTAPDYETLQVIQAARRLYAQKVPLSLVVDMNRKLLTGYTHYKDDPRIIHLKGAVLQYNKRLGQLGLRDHQVESATRDPICNFGVLIVRTFKLLFLFFLSLPGTVLFAPIFIVTNHISAKKQAAALAASVVKIKAIDVVASWKIIVATVFAPSLYITYSVVGTVLTKRYNILGYGSTSAWYIFPLIYAVLVTTTYASFRIGESGSDISKSLPPLVKSVFGSGADLQELKEQREKLSLEVTEVVNLLGPTVFPNFDKFASRKRYADNQDEDEELTSVSSRTRGRRTTVVNSSNTSGESSSRSESRESNALSRVNSEGNLSDIPILGDGDNVSGYYNNSNNSDYDRVLSPKNVGEVSKDAGLKLRTAMRKKINDLKE